MKSLYNPPKILKNIFSEFLWVSAVDKVLLTFDDGPIPEVTESILRELQRHKVKAMFFCVGDNVKKYSSIAKEIIDEGHTIGNHTFHHKKINMLSSTERFAEIDRCSRTIQENLSYEVKYFRPPHGRFNLKLAQELSKVNMQNVMWSLLTYDYKSNFEIVKKSVQKYLEKDSIVVLHDNKKSKSIIKDSINVILEETHRKNFAIGTPVECLK